MSRVTWRSERSLPLPPETVSMPSKPSSVSLPSLPWMVSRRSRRRCRRCRGRRTWWWSCCREAESSPSLPKTSGPPSMRRCRSRRSQCWLPGAARKGKDGVITAITEYQCVFDGAQEVVAVPMIAADDRPREGIDMKSAPSLPKNSPPKALIASSPRPPNAVALSKARRRSSPSLPKTSRPPLTMSSPWPPIRVSAARIRR